MRSAFRFAWFNGVTLRVPGPRLAAPRLLLALFCGLAAGARPATAARPVVVVTTSMGATAVRDLAGDAVDVETLMPPGTCPGQFDLEPRQVRRVQAAALIIRHSMQRFLDERFAAAGVREDVSVALSFGGPFTVPSNYARFCEEAAMELSRRVPSLAETVSERLPAIRARAAETEEVIRRDAAGLAGVRVVAAAYQADFLRWLGIDVVATLPPGDDPAPQALIGAISVGRERGAVLVVGNVQNGRRVPAAVAEAIGVPLVMLSNFPARDTAGAYWELVQSDLQALLDWNAKRSQPRS